MKNKERESGYYWVKTIRDNWIICYFGFGWWSHEGGSYNDNGFKEIDERRIKRDES